MANQSRKERIPEENMSFFFKVDPSYANGLKKSIKALCESEFNPKGLGLVDVSVNGFEINVGANSRTKAVAKLFLSSSGLIDFYYNYNINLIHPQIINLNQIFNATDDDDHDESYITSIFHVDGSSYFTFNFGSTKQVKVDFLKDIDVQIHKVPDLMDICCETVLDYHVLKDTIALDIDNFEQKVSLDISANQVTIITGLNGCWTFDIKKHEENFEAMVLTDDDTNYQVLFEMEHLEALKKASTVTHRFHFGLHLLEPESILMKFKFDKVSELMFVYKAMRIMKNTHNYDVRENLENISEVTRFFNEISWT